MVTDKNESPQTLVSRNEIPVIDLVDMGSVKDPSKEWIKKTAVQLNHALTNYGLAFFINHGIAEERIQAVHNIMDTFCALPDDVKNLYKMGPPEYHQGYIPAGMENLDGNAKEEVRHCYNIPSFSEKLPTEEIPNFIEVVGGVAEEFLNFSQLVLKLIAVALELDSELFLRCHQGMLKEDNLTTIRMLNYPALGEGPLNNITRCGEHSDWGTFTLLSQDIEGGLEVFNGKEWNRVGHLPGALLLNLGDMMELWSSSQYKAVKHRVVVPDSKAPIKCRHSLAFFVHPDNSTTSDPSFFKYCRSGEEVKPQEHFLSAFEHAKRKQKESFGLTSY